jgi:F-type H+-transporting ATPase subunit gamma
MTERLADISARVDGVRQLGAVVNAMRGIAAARVQQARAQVVAVDAYAATIPGAMGRALALVPPVAPKAVAPEAASRLALVLFCAEQGFAGAFSERVLETAGADLTGSDVFLIGTRGAAVASGRGVAVNWKSALPSHSPGIPKLADRIVEALYPRIATGEIGRLDSIVSEWRAGHGTVVERRRLFPFDMTRFPAPATASAPLLNPPPDMLLNEFAADYLHALLCNAALHAFAAENEARMEAMAAAHNQIERQLSALQATRRHVRQEEITAEIIELAAGETASRPDNQRSHQPTSRTSVAFGATVPGTMSNRLGTDQHVMDLSKAAISIVAKLENVSETA